MVTIQTSQTTMSTTKKPLTSATSANLMPEQDVITDIINEYEIERGKSIFKSLKVPKTVTQVGKMAKNLII